MSSVMKTAGSRTVTIADLESIPTPHAMGRFHKPIPLAETVKEWYAALDRAGLVVTKNDLNKYSLEQGVELREMQEQFVNADNYQMTEDDDDDE